jgi:thioredoxin-dependent peroxiredoxin
MLGKRVPNFSLRSFSIPPTTKYPFELLSHGDEALRQLFGVINIKNMYRRKVRGIERSTFVADAKRRVARQWRGVKVPGHVQEVSNFVKAL